MAARSSFDGGRSQSSLGQRGLGVVKGRQVGQRRRVLGELFIGVAIVLVVCYLEIEEVRGVEGVRLREWDDEGKGGDGV